MTKRFSAAVDRGVDATVEWLAPRVSDNTGCVIPMMALLILLIVVPVIFRRMPIWYSLLCLAVIGVSMVVSLAWLTNQHRIGVRSRLLDWTSEIRELNGREFEHLVAAVYEREGFEIRMRGGYRRDGGVDLEVVKDDERYLVQCKGWGRDAVPANVVNLLVAALTKQHLPSSNGIIVAMKDFLPEAAVAAKEFGIQLVHGDDLRARMAAVRRTEPCPLCSDPMVVDKSFLGWWLRCTVPGCKGKRDLGSDADAAVRLLLEQHACTPS